MKNRNLKRAILRNNGFTTSDAAKGVKIISMTSNAVMTFSEPDGDVVTGSTNNVYVLNNNVITDSGIITSLSFNPTTHTFNVSSGDATGVTTFTGYTISDQDGQVIAKSAITFTSSNPSVVSVSSVGVLTFVSVGSYVTITASITSDGNVIRKTMRVNSLAS